MSNYRTAAPVALSLALAACAPQSAILTEGEYTAFIASTNSISLLKDTVDPADYPDAGGTTFNVDCREFESKEDRESLELPDALDICGQAQWPPEYETWATQNGYYVVQESMEPWRGQAIITGEGDIQIAFHQRLPGGADFRFILAVDPDFGPVTCKNDGGDYAHVRRDGDWVAEWSKELSNIADLPDDLQAKYPHLQGLEDGSLYFLNADGYQFDPKAAVNTDTIWSLPREWLAGAAQGKFSEENLFHRAPRYGEPEVYNFVATASETYATGAADDMFFCELAEGEDPAENPCIAELDTHLTDILDGTAKELDRMTTPTGADEPVLNYLPIRHLNNWRPADGLAPGFDGWGELNYSYVAFSKNSVLEVGGSAEGAFAVVLEAVDSQTKVFVQGKFEIPKIRRDKWTALDLEKESLENSGNQLCEAASWKEANLPKPVE
jgi:hypothetical protein